MMPEEDIRLIVHNYPVVTLSEAVQDFYNGPCAAIDIADLNHIDEIKLLLATLVKYHSTEFE
jgi:hypothetical protein